MLRLASPPNSSVSASTALLCDAAAAQRQAACPIAGGHIRCMNEESIICCALSALTGPSIGSELDSLTDGAQHSLHTGHVERFKHQWEGRVSTGNTQWRRLQTQEASPRHRRDDLGAKAACLRGLMADNEAASLANGFADGVDIPRQKGAQVNNLHTRCVVLRSV
mmetsp:Transcript_41486/g.123972  ORF Transcript_41486/g.123972 Transcript_41486/m.123972 type:complete len:165 (-) Transcript_41486:2565-3059(-)